MTRIDVGATYVADVLPAVVVFGLGLCLTVAPLTTTALGSVDEHHTGIASGVNNAVARVAGLLGIAVVGVAVAGRSGAELDLAGFRLGMAITAVVVGAGGLVGLLGIRNPAVASDEEPVVSSSS
jgi:hypothetical protein